MASPESARAEQAAAILRAVAASDVARLVSRGAMLEVRSETGSPQWYVEVAFRGGPTCQVPVTLGPVEATGRERQEVLRRREAMLLEGMDALAQKLQKHLDENLHGALEAAGLDIDQVQSAVVELRRAGFVS